jgi:hypothetical protein
LKFIFKINSKSNYIKSNGSIPISQFPKAMKRGFLNMNTGGSGLNDTENRRRSSSPPPAAPAPPPPPQTPALRLCERDFVFPASVAAQLGRETGLPLSSLVFTGGAHVTFTRPLPGALASFGLLTFNQYFGTFSLHVSNDLPGAVTSVPMDFGVSTAHAVIPTRYLLMLGIAWAIGSTDVSEPIFCYKSDIANLSATILNNKILSSATCNDFRTGTNSSRHGLSPPAGMAL